MLSTTQNTNKYTARIFNITQNKDISDYVSEINIDMPKAREISSMIAKFVLDEKLITSGNKIKIEVLDEVVNIIYSLSGEATLNSINYAYTNADKYSYTVKESYSKLFDRVIAKTETYYDLYLCNNGDENNSLLHIVAKKLGFKNLEFEDAKYPNQKYIRVPFVIFKENERWIDELQSLISATNSILYIENGRLIFRLCNSVLNNDLEFNQTNIITSVEKHLKYTESNGVKVLYDRYERLENQVVFNISKKILVDANTNKDIQVKAMRIKYITSSVANPTITKATAYYFTREDDINSKVKIKLVEGTHYVLDEFTETGAIVKFYNPTDHLIYIDNFEIKGIPLVMYKDNEAVVKDSDVLEKHQKNFELISKNKYVQTLEMANYIAEQEYSERIKSEYSYRLDTHFLNNVKLGNVYGLSIKDIFTKGRVISYSIHLKPSDFRLKVHLEEVKEVGQIKKSNTDNLTPATQFIDLTNIEKAIEENKKEITKTKEERIRAEEIINKKILSVLHKQEDQPTNAKEYDVWLNPKTNKWKQFLNNKWIPVSEKDILPSMKFFNSLDNAQLSMGVVVSENKSNTDRNIENLANISNENKNMLNEKINRVNRRAGLFLTNNDEKFGATNGTLAEVSLDKKGTVRLKNANNLLEWNVKDPANPSRMKSKLYMGVTDVNAIPDNVYFKVGDEATGFSIELKEGKSKATIDGKDLVDKFRDADRNINNLANINNENKRTLEQQINAGVKEAVSAAERIGDWNRNELNKTKSDIDNKLMEEKEKNYYLSLMANGKMLYTDPEFKKWYNSTYIYRRSGQNTTITRKLLASNDSNYPPNTTGYVLEINNDGKSYSDIGHGGFYFANASRKEAIFIAKIIAKIPSGCTINLASNGTGNNSVRKFLGNAKGTGKYETYYALVKCGSNGAFSSTNFFNIYGKKGQSFKWYVAYATVFDCTASDYRIDEIDKKFTNADGRLTTLQQNYQDTVQDITSFKTQTVDRIDTVQGALEEGNFVITQNTTFDGAARFISRGTDEVITISNGSIDFHRNGQRLTRIKNIRYGSIATDSRGKGIVNFDGFKQPMIVMASIKSANFGKNMASVFCYPEHIEDCKYRFYVGGTNEHYTEARPVKVMGTVWSADNVVKTTFESLTLKINSISLNLEAQRSWYNNAFSYGGLPEEGKKWIESLPKKKKVNNPTLEVELYVYINNSKQLLFKKRYPILYKIKNGRNRDFRVYVNPIIIDEKISFAKSFSSRTNIRYEIKTSIKNPELYIYNLYHHTDRSRDKDHDTRYRYFYYFYHGIIKTFTTGDILNKSITASVETSTISSATGRGEVSYIAMEID